MARPKKKDAYITDPEIFKRLIGAVDKFVLENKENVQKVDEFIFEKENELQKIKEILEQRLVEAQHKLENCNMELAMCRQRVEYDENGNLKKPSCNSEDRAVIKAQRQEKAAQKALNQMAELMRYARQWEQEYDSKKRKFMQLLENKLSAGQGTLNKHDQIMKEYLNLNTNKDGKK